MSDTKKFRGVIYFQAKKLNQFFILFLVAVACTDCASLGHKLKSWVGGTSDSSSDTASNGAGSGQQGPPVTSFSNTANLNPSHERKYKRVTKDNFGEDQDLQDNAGSLWRREGQGSYLFSQNNLRNLGDVVNVDVEGKAADNLNNKLKIIKQALARLEAPPQMQIRAPASKSGIPKPEAKPAATQANNGAGPAGGAVTGAGQDNNNATPEQNQNAETARELAAKFDTVPCRIVEKIADGSYRVKGQTPVYVGRREYRLIVLGVVRPDDISTDTVASTKLIDGRFDLVATMKDTPNATTH